MSDLNKKVANAAKWSMVNTVVRRFGTFAAGVVLARFFFGPEDYGIYAVGLVVLGVLMSGQELGVDAAMVNWEGDPRRFAPTVLSLTTLSSCVIYVGLYLSAPTVAELLGAPHATLMLRLLCTALIVDGLVCVPIGLLTREFRQGRIALVETLNFAVNTAVTIGLATLGLGPISFAWGSIAGNLVALVTFYAMAPQMLRFGWNREMVPKLLRFGLPRAGASMLVLASLSVDSMIVGALLGPATLGLYQMALNMSSWPVKFVSDTARRVSFAGFSRLAETGQLNQGFQRGMTLLVTAAMPMSVLLCVLADPVIRFAYGDKWAAAAVPLTFLAVLGLLRVALDLAYDALSASHGKILLLTQGWWLITLVPVLYLLARSSGVVGVAAGQLLVAAALVVPALLWGLSKVGVSPRGVLAVWARPLAGGIVMGAVAWGLHQLVGGGFIGLAVCSSVAIAVYVPFAWPVVRTLRRRTPDSETEPETVPLATATPLPSGSVE